MQPPAIAYALARMMEAEEIRGAEARRRRHEPGGSRAARAATRTAGPPRRRLARLATVLANGGEH